MNAIRPISDYSAEPLIARLVQARAQLRALIEHLPRHGWLGPRAEHLNPPLWEYGHIVWFQERWCLRARADGSFAPSCAVGVDALYDSSSVAHDTRWDLPLLAPHAVDDYAAQVAQAIAVRLRTRFDNEIAYYAELSLYHELMHVEAWWVAFQNLGYAPPPFSAPRVAFAGKKLAFAEGSVELGSGADAGFVFDNEKWRHRVDVPAFDIDASPVSETQFARFVDTGGYRRSEFWSAEGWGWRTRVNAVAPLYWRQREDEWLTRRFERWLPLDSGSPVLHVNRFEAEAYAAWTGRRLPSAAEWVRAEPQPDFVSGVCWEWLRDPFVPYPGFSPDPYRDYSQPWFHTHWELRGGGPHTDVALKRTGFRNFYLPHRRDLFTGFRTASGSRSFSRRSST